MNKEIVERVLHEIDEYFDNSNNTIRNANNLIQSIYEALSGETKSNVWQPDWTQAPKNVVKWQCVGDGALWTLNDGTHKPAPRFDYQGYWMDSSRERP